MKHFALVSLLVSAIFVTADIVASEYIPWHWDDEAVNVNAGQESQIELQQTKSISKTEDEAEPLSELGW